MKILLCGSTGRMGRSVIELINNVYMEHEISAAISSSTSHDDLLLGCKNSDLIIDFSAPIATEKTMQAAIHNKIPYLLCVTGIEDDALSNIKQAGKYIPILYAPNTSIGANLISCLAGKAAKILADYDAEIIDIHHRYKKDAPSGTALSIAESIANARNIKLKNNIHIGRKGNSLRASGEIGISSLRSGGVIGQHNISFASEKEVVTISHQALTRDLFADGAIKASKWLVKQDPGFYEMADMFKFT